MRVSEWANRESLFPNQVQASDDANRRSAQDAPVSRRTRSRAAQEKVFGLSRSRRFETNVVSLFQGLIYCVNLIQFLLGGLVIGIASYVIATFSSGYGSFVTLDAAYVGFKAFGV